MDLSRFKGWLFWKCVCRADHWTNS